MKAAELSTSNKKRRIVVIGGVAAGDLEIKFISL